MSLNYGYVTNGLADHRIEDAIPMLAANGYRGIGLTLDHHHLDPLADDLEGRVRRIKTQLDEFDMSVVVETGGRFVLDAQRKHYPNLLTDGRARRVDFLQRAVHIAAELDAHAVSFWSGIQPADISGEVAWDRLVDGCSAVLETAEAEGVALSFEPEPGMLLEYVEQWERLAKDLGDPVDFGITLDLGHCHAIEDQSVADCIRRAGSRLFQVQIEDMKRGVHEHLNFGDGDMVFPPALAALSEIDYQGLVCVELSRHSHTAHTVVPAAIEFLQAREREGSRE